MTDLLRVRDRFVASGELRPVSYVGTAGVMLLFSCISDSFCAKVFSPVFTDRRCVAIRVLVGVGLSEVRSCRKVHLYLSIGGGIIMDSQQDRGSLPLCRSTRRALRRPPSCPKRWWGSCGAHTRQFTPGLGHSGQPSKQATGAYLTVALLMSTYLA